MLVDAFTLTGSLILLTRSVNSAATLGHFLVKFRKNSIKLQFLVNLRTILNKILKVCRVFSLCCAFADISRHDEMSQSTNL